MKKLYSRLMAMGINSYLLATTAYAQELPTGTPITLGTIETIIFQIADFIIIVAGFIMVIMIVYSGIKYMMAGDDSAKATEARGMLKNAVIGAVIVVGIGAILATVDYFITTQSLY